MKSYSFYMNANDWLASGSVKLMSKAERGCYIDLLCIAWGSERSGTLPASEDKVRRLAELTPADWVVSGETLLEMWPLSECGTYRYNKRLMVEVEKEERKSEKAKQSADMRWQSERNANASKKNANASKKQCERNAQEQEQEQGTTTVVGGGQSLPAKNQTPAERAAGRAVTDNSPTFTADNWPGLTNATTFASICADLRLPLDLDRESYRAAIQDKMRSQGMEAQATTLRSWINTYFLNAKKGGPLLTLLAATIDLTRSTPRHEYPAEGTDCTGRHIVLANAGDANMNRMAAAACLKGYPNATIHHTR